jgi:hypothetical protein
VKVAYSADRPLFRPGNNDGDLFHTKSLDWQYEDEYRKFQAFEKGTPLPEGGTFVHFPPLSEIDATNWPLRLLDIPPEAIREIILGHRISAESKTAIFAALKTAALKHVRCSQAAPDPKIFRMARKPVAGFRSQKKPHGRQQP